MRTTLSAQKGGIKGSSIGGSGKFEAHEVSEKFLSTRDFRYPSHIAGIGGHGPWVIRNVFANGLDRLKKVTYLLKVRGEEIAGLREVNE